jgi:hypothetical protein
MASAESSTPSTQPAAAASKKATKAPSTDTALHIIKGAVVKVLNTPLTLTTEAKSATKVILMRGNEVERGRSKRKGRKQ